MNEMPSTRKALLDGILFLLLTASLVVRCMHGLDLSDEMQYYGQIAALTAKGRLFETDLFVQQLVYVPFYPFFKLHAALFQQAGLVLFGRALLAACLVALFVYARRFMRKLGGGHAESGLAALALTFAASYHGIFAISYNTISQLGWVLFLLWFVEWPAGRWWRWATLVVLTGFAHPAAAILMGALLSVRLLIERRFAELLAWFAWAALVAGLALGVLLCFTSWQDLWQSLVFSKGFAVGSSLLSDPRQWRAACVFLLSLTVLNLLPLKWLVRLPWSWIWCVMALLAIRSLLIGHPVSGYTAGIARMGAWLVVVALARYRAGIDPKDASAVARLRWLTVGIAAHFLTLVITSSNGLGQGTGAMLVALPVLLGLTSVSCLPGRPSGQARLPAWAAACLMLLLSLVHWSVGPYRDSRWYQPSSPVTHVAAFQHIWTSPAHVAWLNAFQQRLSGSLRGQDVLIVSEKPALYFALGVEPQTCMLYMHSTGAASAAEVLKACLERRHPSHMLYVRPDGLEEARINPVYLLADEYARTKGLHCPDDKDAWSLVEPVGMSSVQYRLCQHR